MINILLSTFPGLGLPKTLCIPFTEGATYEDVHDYIRSRLPPSVSYDQLVLCTTSAEQLPHYSSASLSSLCRGHADNHFLSLRLQVPCLGGKGGFGSQLRAQGGKMSSRKKRAGPVVNSNRNLEGRRIRTVGEAKALAEYLSVKPEMERKEREERRRRWEAVVESADRTEQEMKDGTYRKTGQRGDGTWIEEKEDTERKIREAVAKAMEDGVSKDEALRLVEPPGSSEESIEGSEGSDDSEPVEAADKSAASSSKAAGKARKVWGWDDEDEDMSSSDGEE